MAARTKHSIMYHLAHLPRTRLSQTSDGSTGSQFDAEHPGLQCCEGSKDVSIIIQSRCSLLVKPGGPEAKTTPSVMRGGRVVGGGVEGAAS